MYPTRFDLGKSSACDEALVGAIQSCGGDKEETMCLLRMVTKLKECGESGLSPVGSSREVLCDSMYKADIGMKTNLLTRCQPMQQLAMASASNCAWYQWVGCYFAVLLAAAACYLATGGLAAIPCISLLVSAIGCIDCICDIIHCK